MEKIGFVVGNKPANPLEFWIGIERGKVVQLDDLVKVETYLENGKKIFFYGVVTELYRYLEGSEFVFDSMDFVQGRLPAHLAYIAKVQVNRIEEEIYIPPFPGDSVYLIRNSVADLEKALYFDQMKLKIPAGVLRNGEPVFINYHFLNGKDGAHVSISGISGVASKTSYALFLLYSILNKVSSEERINAIIFNVKGEDLFFLDKPNKVFKEREKEFLPVYQKLGLKAEPFKGVKFFAPPEREGSLIPNVETRKQGVKTYLWTLREFAEEELLKFMFVEGEGGLGSIHYVIDKVTERLKELAEQTKEWQSNNPSWEGRLMNFDLFDEEGNPLPPQEFENLRDILRFLKELVKRRRLCNADKTFRKENEDFCNKVAEIYEQWFGTVTVSVAYAFIRRFDQAIQYISPMVVSPDLLAEKNRADFKIDWRSARLTVIGINKLHNIAQMFVVGAILKKLFKEKERSGRLPVVYIILDELNKYAPRGGWSPIKDILLDIAERGRSLGIILIGAQQTASEVEKRIVANASIKVTGRLDASEVAAREYDFLPPAYKQRAILLKKGQIILHQPDVPLPLIVQFPFPAWATRAEEVYEEINDEDIEIFDNFDIDS